MAHYFVLKNYVKGTGSTGNNWGIGYYSQGSEVIDEFMDLMRKEIEICDCLQGFQITNSLGGGTGSGLGSLCMTKLRECYPEKLMSNYSVIPAPTSTVVVEPYNTILSLHHQIENSDLSFLFDNEALNDISSQSMRLNQNDLNNPITTAMCGITCSFRFPGEMLLGLRKMATSLVIFPRMHFFQTSIAPLLNRNSSYISFEELTTGQLTHQLFSESNSLIKSDPKNGTIYTSNSIYRGDITSHEIDDNFKSYNHLYPFHAKNSKSVCYTPAVGQPVSATLIANSSSINSMFQRILSQFETMFNRKAFLFPYHQVGMDDCEFTESAFNAKDLISEYDRKFEED